MKAHRPLPLDPYLVDCLVPDLVGHDRKASAFLVYLYLWRHTHGSGLAHVESSLSTISVDTGLSKRTVQSALAHLAARGLVSTKKPGPTDIPRYTVNRPWHRPNRTDAP